MSANQPKPKFLIVGTVGYNWENEFEDIMLCYHKNRPFHTIISEDEKLVKSFTEKCRINFVLAKRKLGWFRSISFQEQNETLLKTYKPDIIIIFGDHEKDMNMLQVAERANIPCLRPEVTENYIITLIQELRNSYETYGRALDDLEKRGIDGENTARLALSHLATQRKIREKIVLLKEIYTYRPHSNEFAIIIKAQKKEEKKNETSETNK